MTAAQRLRASFGYTAGMMSTSEWISGLGKWCMLLAVLWLAGCASMQKDFEQPSVELIGIRALPSEGMSPQFEIDLRIINPNRSALNLKGASYSVSIEGYELIKGVAADLPTVPAYGEAKFRLRAGMSWMQGIKFLTSMANESRDTVTYEMNAKLDLGAFTPAIRISEKGVIGVAELKKAAK